MPEQDKPAFNKNGLRSFSLALLPSIRPYLGGEGEGTNLTARPLWMQEILLRFDKSLLNGLEVLNFGCGIDAPLMDGLAKEGVKPKKIYRIDANPDLAPYGVTVARGEELDRHLRNGAVDLALALFVMHQIPIGDREVVYRNLMKVSRRYVHAGPIFGADLKLLTEIVPQCGFDIVVCHPFQKDDGFMPKTWNDYEEMLRRDSSYRIETPRRENPFLIRALGMRHLDYSGGSYIVLGRTDCKKTKKTKK